MKIIFNKIILMILISSIPNLSAHDLQSAVNSEDRDPKMPRETPQDIL
jgi:hypothetical protein